MGSWKRYITALVINIVLTLAVLLLRGFDLKIYYVDAFSVAGAVSILLGLLSWITAAGAFDTIGYGFSTLGSNRRYKDLYEYTVGKKEKRSRQGRTFLPYLVVGWAFQLISYMKSACSFT